jgi:hypothetical protein
VCFFLQFWCDLNCYFLLQSGLQFCAFACAIL